MVCHFVNFYFNVKCTTLQGDRDFIYMEKIQEIKLN